MTEKTYTVNDLMERWDCSYNRAIKAMHAWGMEVYRIGAKLRITESSVLEYERKFMLDNEPPRLEMLRRNLKKQTV